MKKFHAYQIVTDSAYDLRVDEDSGAIWAKFINSLKSSIEKIIRIEIGELEAEDVGEALDRIRANDWDCFFVNLAV